MRSETWRRFSFSRMKHDVTLNFTFQAASRPADLIEEPGHVRDPPRETLDITSALLHPLTGLL